MAQKKDRSRFTIKFRESDPAHDMTIRILENQGQRNIAPFLVNAVLHYVQCSETPDMSHMLAEKPAPMVDRNAIEEIVVGILWKKGIIREEDISVDNSSSQNVVNEEMIAMITRTLSAFRRE